MKKGLMYLFLLLTVFCLTGCNIDIAGGNNKLPSTIDEVNRKFSIISGCVYEVEDIKTTYIEGVEGATIELIAQIDEEFILGVCFESNSAAKKSYDAIIEPIKESIQYEFNKNPEEFNIKINGCWIYAGTEKIVSYFEGKTESYKPSKVLAQTVEEVVAKFEKNSYEVDFIEFDEDDPEGIGVKNLIIAGKEKDISEAFIAFQMKSHEKAIEHEEELKETLREGISSEFIEDAGWTIGEINYYVKDCWVYAGTTEAINIFLGE